MQNCNVKDECTKQYIDAGIIKTKRGEDIERAVERLRKRMCGWVSTNVEWCPRRQELTNPKSEVMVDEDSGL